MNTQTEIWSIYGQIDEVVARAMAEEGKLNLIPYDTIPASQRFDEHGNVVRLAVVVHRAYVTEYNRRVAELRS